MAAYRLHPQSRRRDGCIAALAASAFAVLATAPRAAAESAPPVTLAAGCVLEPGPRQTVTSVIDAETLRLHDGSEVRLIGALAPRAPDAAAGASEWPFESEAKRALEALAQGRNVRLAYAGPRRDRYGRHLAHVVVTSEGGAEIWLQGAMLAAGHARAYGLAGSYACSDALIAAEATARIARLGLWSSSAYAPRPAWRSRELAGLAGSYQIVEGKVRSASRARERIYLNFGRDWRDDFSLAIAPEIAAAEPAWAAGLLDLAGKTVRARGWIEIGNGPKIEIAHPSQIEIVARE